MRLILFDCDGTIADSFAVICGTLQAAFRARGLTPPTDDAIHRIIGLSLPEAMMRLRPGIDRFEAEELAEAYRDSFRRARSSGGLDEPLFGGMAALLRKYAAVDGNIIGMVTGKSRRGVAHILETHGLEQIFYVVRTADDCPSKPHPAMVLECCEAAGISPSMTVVVGDASFDMAMARAAGAAGIGVSWGAGIGEDLLQAGAFAVAEDTADLDRLLTGWVCREPDGQPVAVN